MAEARSGEPAETFPLMLLPLEIRREIYKNLLITSCTQPGVPRKTRFGSKNKGPQHDEFPCVQILRISKTINAEATTILYAYNTFTTVFVKGNDQLYDMLEAYVGPLMEFPPGWNPHWDAAMSGVIDAVAKIFEPDTQKLPVWLFGSRDTEDRTLQDTIKWVNSPSYMYREYSDDYDEGGAFDFPAFLRQIGRSNAAIIRKVQLTFTDLPRAADHLPLYAEILKQHVTSLQKLTIDCGADSSLGLDFDLINDYGSEMEWEEREEHSLESDERLFTRLRQLLKDLPNLKDLAFTWCDDMYNEMGRALLKAENIGKEFDIRQMWIKLREACHKVNGAGFRCDCRRQCCLLIAPESDEKLGGLPYERWRCTWNETWYEGI